jgi:hypothetical protein
MGCCDWNVVRKTPTVPAVAPPTDPLHLIALHRARAEVALMEVSDGAPLCRVGEPGTVGVKQAEGRLFAIVELERALRSSALEPPEVVAHLIGRWRTMGQQVAARGEGWSAYQVGGIAALEDLASQLDALNRGTAP